MWSKQIHNTISKKYCYKLIQIQWKMNLTATFINQIPTQFHTDCWSWLGSKCECKNQQIQLKNVTNTCKKTGGAELKNWRCSSGSCSDATNGRMKVLSEKKWLSIPGLFQWIHFFMGAGHIEGSGSLQSKIILFWGYWNPNWHSWQLGNLTNNVPNQWLSESTQTSVLLNLFFVLSYS